MLSQCPNCKQRTLNPLKVAFNLSPWRCANCNALLAHDVRWPRGLLMVLPLLAFASLFWFAPSEINRVWWGLATLASLALMIRFSTVRVVEPHART